MNVPPFWLSFEILAGYCLDSDSAIRGLEKAFYSHFDNLLLITFAIKWLNKVEVQFSDPKIEGFFFIDLLLGKPNLLSHLTKLGPNHEFLWSQLI